MAFPGLSLASSLIQYPYPVVQTAEFRVGHNVLMLQVKIQNTGNLFHLYTYFFISNGGKNEEPQHNCYKSQMVQAGSFYNNVRS